MDVLHNRNIWRAVREYDLPKLANVLGIGLVLTIKNCEKPDEKAGFIYISQRINLNDKTYMVN